MANKETKPPGNDPALFEARKTYNAAVGMVLWQFQLIEETLKTYLDVTFDLIRARLGRWAHTKKSKRETYPELTRRNQLMVSSALII
jgi:hypothetical protein